MSQPAPQISVLMANYNGGQFIAAAIGSILRSSGVTLEIIVADDGSTDDSADIVAHFAAQDGRVRWLPPGRMKGPAAARNRAMSAASGEWLAVVDSDDLIAPDRFERLLAFASARSADLVADNLLLFSSDDSERPRLFLDRAERAAPFEVTAALYLRQTVLYGPKPNLGFLKPLFRRSALVREQICYDETLRIAEDDDVVTQCLAADLRYFVDPAIGYFYRQHAHSITRGYCESDRQAILDAIPRVSARLGHKTGAAAPLHRRNRSILAASHYHRFIDALRAGMALAQLPRLLSSAGAVALLRQPVIARLKRLHGRFRPRVRPQNDGRRHIMFISRQRILGRFNGSSVYLLDIAAALRAAGFVPHLLQPTPRITGRMPFMKPSVDLAIFESHLVRGTWRVGERFVVPSLRLWLRAAGAVIGRLARKAGLPAPPDRPLPHTINIDWTDDDLLFVADHARARGDLVICDYIFQTEALPFVLRPDARTAILIHDLYSLRAENFAALGLHDSVADAGKKVEIKRIAAVDAAIAIQQQEADWIADAVPSVQALVTPIAMQPVAQAQAGEDDMLLFVGSNTPPNVIGLLWFLEAVWPMVIRHRPMARLMVAGTMCDTLGTVPAGVNLLGRVDDLEQCYARAGVVISPLTVGSGLKIKLIEAMSFGKAIVATPTTLQGVEALASGAVCVQSDAETFAHDLILLLNDSNARAALGNAALNVIHSHFAPNVAYESLINWAKAAE